MCKAKFTFFYLLISAPTRGDITIIRQGRRETGPITIIMVIIHLIARFWTGATLHMLHTETREEPRPWMTFSGPIHTHMHENIYTLQCTHTFLDVVRAEQRKVFFNLGTARRTFPPFSLLKRWNALLSKCAIFSDMKEMFIVFYKNSICSLMSLWWMV